MSLENLVKIGQLHRHAPAKDEIAKLVRNLERSLAAARLEGLSPEGKFRAAYEAALLGATVALRASGYRTGADTPGHHALTIQSLAHTLGVSPDVVRQFDACRRKRNIISYEGDESLSRADIDAVLAIAERLRMELAAWLQQKHPELL